MKKSERVKSKILFNKIINNGKKRGNSVFTIFFSESNNKTLFGVSAPKKCGNAVIRNKLKRQMREIIHDTRSLFKNNRNYIIIIKKVALDMSYKDIKAALIELIGVINEE